MDGERELELDPAERLMVELDLGGPLTLNVDTALAYASRQGLLRA